jgi:UDP-N-acetylmuramate--alanine ligase
MPLFIPDDPRPIHFMGMAGAGMSALALIARSRGAAVTGCDSNPAAAEDLATAGISMVTGHDSSHVTDARAIVYTAAIADDHPELLAARERGIPVLKRAEALAEVVRHGTIVAVAGTHGKTTTTVMVTTALEAVGRDPTGIAGGRVAGWGGNARIGREDLYVVEADEYDRSFLRLDPTVAIVNNVEADHLECYSSLQDLEDSFLAFASRAEQVLVGADDDGARRLGGRLDGSVWHVGVAADADLKLTEIHATPDASVAQLFLPDGRRVELRLRVPGSHNLQNAAMAVGATLAVGADPAVAAESLATFDGVARRFDVLGTEGGVTVVDDYAHHATEVAATLTAARERYPSHRIVAVFQPHLFSRTAIQGEALGRELATADMVVVSDIYPAREQPIPGVSAALVVDAAREAGAEVEWVRALDALPDALSGVVRNGDVVLTMGAGDITEVGPALLRRLAEVVA